MLFLYLHFNTSRYTNTYLMGRSTETFNKKEREKKKLKKQQDKKEKAEERKASGSKGGSLDDMMAYVDEDGNITSTPPDGTRRKQVDAESIQTSVPRQEDIPLETVRQGTVNFFNEAKGFGFITDTQTRESIFVHVNALSQPVRENDKVTFEVEPGQKGPTAVKVQLIK